MWFRNLFFLALVAAGVVGLGVLLYPPDRPPRAHHFDPGAFQEADFRSAVARVNAAVDRTVAEAELRPAPAAPELTVVRRLALALTGTIPSLQEVRQLEAQAPDERLQWWLTGTFQDRRYADYLAERLARAYVGTENGPFVVFRRRRFVSWLSDQLAQNRPYDQIVRELIAAEGLWTDRPATNFITVTMEPDNKKGPNPVRLAGKVTRAFLGVRLDCAQCHNHPFQKWTQHNFKGLAAFFGQVQQGFTGIYDGKGDYTVENRKTGKPETIEPDVPFLKELLPADGTRRQRLARWVTDPHNPYFARAAVNRMWALLFGRPMVEPVDDLGSVPEVPPALQLLADDFVAHQFDLQHLIRVIAATEAFQRDSAAGFEITEAHERVGAAFPLTRLRPEQLAGSVIQSASLETVNESSHILVKLARFFQENDFIKRYGDKGDDEFDDRGGTLPQTLVMMNGQLVRDRTAAGDFANAAGRIASLAPDDARAVETAYLAVLTRRPTPEEAGYFERRLAGRTGTERSQCLEDLYWTLVNSTEFSWNH
jgi:hypothetical protein